MRSSRILWGSSMPERVTLNQYKRGTHVITIDSPTEKTPAIILSWEEARLLASLLAPPLAKGCRIPRDQCLPCGLREELLAMIAERGPKT